MNRYKEPKRALFYALIMPELQELGKLFGYAICFHGSLSTDLDIVAVPWIHGARPAEDLIEAIRAFVGGRLAGIPTAKPHGRRAWSIYDCKNIGGGDDPYLDISVLMRADDLQLEVPNE